VPARRAQVVLVGHGLLSPCALAGLTAFFVAFFVPAYWVATVLRRRELSDTVRERARRVAESFSYEAATAPFLVLGVTAFAPFALAGLVAPALAMTVFVILLVALVPPALGWYAADC
jgi:hypothetical protein